MLEGKENLFRNVVQNILNSSNYKYVILNECSYTYVRVCMYIKKYYEVYKAIKNLDGQIAEM